MRMQSNFEKWETYNNDARAESLRRYEEEEHEKTLDFMLESLFALISDFTIIRQGNDINKDTYRFKYEGVETSALTTETLLDTKQLNMVLIKLSQALFPLIPESMYSIYVSFWAELIEDARLNGRIERPAQSELYGYGLS